MNTHATMTAMLLGLVAMASAAPPATAPATLKPETRVMVTVVDATTRQPIKNASVQYTYNYQFPQVHTDGQGQALVVLQASLDPWLWVRVNAPDHVAVQVHRPADAGEAGEKEPRRLTVALAQATTLGGTVVNADGKPLAGAKVSFVVEDKTAHARDARSPWTYVRGEATTDKNGRWSANVFPVGEEPITFHVEHDDYAKYESDSAPIGKDLRSQKSVITIHYPLAIRFTVTDAETGQQIADPRAFQAVALFKTKTSSAQDRNNIDTIHLPSSDGEFSFTFGARVLQGALRIEADGYEPVTSPQITRDEQRRPLIFDAKLKKKAAKP
jgi:hypothetical protein